jgi:hypothetical protein
MDVDRNRHARVMLSHVPKHKILELFRVYRGRQAARRHEVSSYQRAHANQVVETFALCATDEKEIKTMHLVVAAALLGIGVESLLEPEKRESKVEHDERKRKELQKEREAAVLDKKLKDASLLGAEKLKDAIPENFRKRQEELDKLHKELFPDEIVVPKNTISQAEIDKIKLLNDEQDKIATKKLRDYAIEKHYAQEKDLLLQKHQNKIAADLRAVNEERLKEQMGNTAANAKLNNYATDKFSGLKRQTRLENAEKVMAASEAKQQQLSKERHIQAKKRLNEHQMEKEHAFAKEQKVQREEEQQIFSNDKMHAQEKFNEEMHRDLGISERPNIDEMKIVNDKFHAAQEFDALMKTSRNTTQRLPDTPLPLRAMSKLADTTDFVGSVAKTAVIAGGIVGAGIVGAGMVGKGILNTAADLLPIKENKESMPISQAKAEGVARKFLVTLTLKPAEAYSKLADTYNVQEFTEILKRAAIIEPLLNHKVRDDFSDPDKAASLWKQYYVPKTDPEYASKVPKSWANVKKGVYPSYQAVKEPDIIQGVNSTIGASYNKRTNEGVEYENKIAANNLFDWQRAHKGTNATEDMAAASEVHDARLIEKEAPILAQQAQDTERGNASREANRQKEEADRQKALLREQNEPEYNRLVSKLSNATKSYNRGKTSLDSISTDIKRLVQLQKDMDIYAEPTEIQKRHDILSSINKFTKSAPGVYKPGTVAQLADVEGIQNAANDKQQSEPSNYREYLKLLPEKQRKAKEQQLYAVAEHEGISMDEAYKRASESENVTLLKRPGSEHDYDIPTTDNYLPHSTGSPGDLANDFVQGVINPSLNPMSDIPEILARMRPLEAKTVSVNSLMTQFDPTGTTTTPGIESLQVTSRTPRLAAEAASQATFNNQQAQQAEQIKANADAAAQPMPGNAGFVGSGEKPYLAGPVFGATQAQQPNTAFPSTSAQPGLEPQITPINLGVTPEQSTSGILHEAAQNMFWNGAAVAGSMLASAAFGPQFGAFVMGSMYNNYLKDIAQQNQVYSGQANAIANKAQALAIGSWEAFQRTGALDTSASSKKDFLEGKSVPTKRKAEDETSAERIVKSRNEFNDMGFEAQKMNPMTTVSDFSLVSQEVSQAFDARASKDLVKESQQDFQSWNRNNVPFAVRQSALAGRY